MVQEAERYKSEDEANRDRVAAKNAVESLYLQHQADGGRRETEGESAIGTSKILDKCQEVINWLDPEPDGGKR